MVMLYTVGKKIKREEDSHKNHGLKIICSVNIDANMMSRDKDGVYDTLINIYMDTARKKKGIIKTLHFGKK